MTPIGDNDDACVEPDDLTVLAGVAGWAMPFLRGDAPQFGSVEWLALPLDDPRRAAAVVRAALAWWRCGDSLDDQLESVDAAEDKLSALGVSRGNDWDDTAHWPTIATLQHRRRQLPAGYREVTVADAIADWAALEQAPIRRAAG